MYFYFKNYWFTFYLLIIVFITSGMIIQNNQNIYNFKKLSVDHMITLEMDSEQVGKIQKKLENITFQPVIVEPVGKDRYRIFLRCPPDRYDQISGEIKN